MSKTEEPVPVRLAATGDIHCRDSNRDTILERFATLAGEADLLLVAGDLTSHGTPEEAAILCEAAAEFGAPVFAVLGNHDFHAGKEREIGAALEEGGVRLLEGEAAICDVRGIEVGVVGCKGFIGGFAPHHLPDFGEASLRGVYEETGAEVAALDAGLREVAASEYRVVLLHYAPVRETLKGEPPEIFPFLGSDRLAGPVRDHTPDLVLHGHAHEGAHEGSIGGVPVRNVSLPVLGDEFWRTEITPPAHGPIP